MKKIIITETQAMLLKAHINEANDADKAKVIDEYFKEIKLEFGETIKNAKIGDTIMLTFGVEKDDDSGEIDDTTMTAITFLVVGVGKGSVTVKHIKSKGKDLRLNTQDKNKEYFIFPKMSLAFNKGYPYFILKVKQENNQYKDYPIQNFQTSTLYSENLDAETVKPYSENPESMENNINIDSRISDTAKKYSEMRKRLMGKILYDPSVLGMDNFFFYPKGLIEMDKIAQKYGVSVHSDNSNKVKFTIVGGNVPETPIKTQTGQEVSRLISNGRYVGEYNPSKKTITLKDNQTSFIIHLNSGDVMASNTTFLVEVDVLFLGKKVGGGSTSIKITKLG